MGKTLFGAVLGVLVTLIGLMLNFGSFWVELETLRAQLENDRQNLAYQEEMLGYQAQVIEQLRVTNTALKDFDNKIVNFLNGLVSDLSADSNLPQQADGSSSRQLETVTKLQKEAESLGLEDIEHTLTAILDLLGNRKADGPLSPEGLSSGSPSGKTSSGDGVSASSLSVPLMAPLPLEPVDGPKGNLILCVPAQKDSYIKVYRLVDAGKNQRGENLVRWERWDKYKVNYGSRTANGSIKVDGLPVNIFVFGDEGEPYKVELYVNGELQGVIGDILAGQDPFLVMPARDNYIKQWSAPC